MIIQVRPVLFIAQLFHVKEKKRTRAQSGADVTRKPIIQLLTHFPNFPPALLPNKPLPSHLNPSLKVLLLPLP